jgi:DNA-binding transcriptional ArsR family regulator
VRPHLTVGKPPRASGHRRVAIAEMCHSAGNMTEIRDELFQLHASVCKGLADPKRLFIINALRDGELSVSEICHAVDLPQANVSQHLAVLRSRGLVVSRREAQRVYYRVASPKINQALDLLLEVMAEQLTLSGA